MSKKKFSNTKTVASLLGLALLAGGLGTGILLVTQQQIFKSGAVRNEYSPAQLCSTTASCSDTQLRNGSSCTDPRTNATRYCCPRDNVNVQGTCRPTLTAGVACRLAVFNNTRSIIREMGGCLCEQKFTCIRNSDSIINGTWQTTGGCEITLLTSSSCSQRCESTTTPGTLDPERCQ